MLCDGERISLDEVAERLRELQIQVIGEAQGANAFCRELECVRAATSLPLESTETQSLRLAGRSIAEALVAVEDARGALTTIHTGLTNRLSSIHDAIRAQA